MIYLVMQMLVCLLIAFLLGLLFGWWLGRRKSEDQTDQANALQDLSRCRAELASSRADLKECRSKLENVLENLSGCHAELATSRADLKECLANDGVDDRSVAAPVALADLGADDADVDEVGEETAGDDTGQSVADDAVADDARVQEPAGQSDAQVTAIVAEPDSVAPDDLKVVEGVGPKIEGLLNADGIRTWAKLANTDVSFLQSVLDKAGPRYRIHDPATWPRQAALAAAGSWDELEELQGRLKGGREK